MVLRALIYKPVQTRKQFDNRGFGLSSRADNKPAFVKKIKSRFPNAKITKLTVTKPATKTRQGTYSAKFQKK